MKNKAFKIAVVESERGWGSKIDDWMVCLTLDDINDFRKEFNSKNNLDVVPEWYMYADGKPFEVELNDVQYDILNKHKRVWISFLNKHK